MDCLINIPILNSMNFLCHTQSGLLSKRFQSAVNLKYSNFRLIKEIITFLPEQFDRRLFLYFQV